MMLLTYVVFSSWGLVNEVRPKQIDWGFVVGGLAFTAAIFGVSLIIHSRRTRFRPGPDER